MEITRDVVEKILDLGYGVYTDYPGQGLQGGSCLGVVCSNPVQLSLNMALELGREIASAMLKSADWDSVGGHYVVYFPHVKCDSINGKEPIHTWEVLSQ